MSDCGCGCGSSTGTGCTDNLNSNTKNAQVSGNIKYDGANLSCASDSSIDIVNGEGINSVLQKILTKLCNSNSGNTLVYSDTNYLMTGNVSLTKIFETSTDSLINLKAGEGVKIKVAFNTNNATLAGNLRFKLSVFGEGLAGYYPIVPTLPEVLVTINAGTNAESYMLEATFFRDKTTSTNIYASWKITTAVETYTAGDLAIEYTVFDMNTAALGVHFYAQTLNVSDTVNFEYFSVEHLK